jgi:hypothetical protein
VGEELTQTCRKCGKVKLLSEYYMNGDRRFVRCKACISKDRLYARLYGPRAPGPRLTYHELVEYRKLGLLLYDWERLAQVPGKTRRAKVLWLLDLADRQK